MLIYGIPDHSVIETTTGRALLTIVAGRTGYWSLQVCRVSGYTFVRLGEWYFIRFCSVL